jgi:hypothetical protein
MPDLGSRIPNPYFLDLFVKFVATKNGMTTNFSHPSLLLLFLDPGWIRDPGSGMGKNQDPGSGINIPDPQHCF